MSEWRPAPEVAAIAADLIPKYHPSLLTEGVTIRYVFRRKATKSAGRVILGTARKVGGIPALLAEHEPDEHYLKRAGLFVIEIAEDEWDALDGDQRVALVDHELTHCWVNDEGPLKLEIVGHDVEEFAQIVERHGLWKGDLRAFAQAIAVHDGGDG